MTDQAFADRLQPLVVTGDVDGVQALLSSLEGEAVKEAQEWLTQARRWLDSIPYDAFGNDHDQHRRWHTAYWILGLVAVELSGPVTAARRVLWGELWTSDCEDGMDAVIRSLSGRSREWAAEFVDEASRARLTGNSWEAASTLARVIRAVGRHHRLDCPTGPTFYLAWVAGCPEPTLEGCLAADPWMPDLLHRYLASGHCGGSRALPEAVAALLQRGLLDRPTLLREVLSVLTAPQRPGNQLVLAKIVGVLAPTAEEIPGGLDYLLGVISTSTGAVGRVLLPPALSLVTNGDELAQLTAVLAARQEKDQKKRLLTAMMELSGRVGTEAVLASLDVLAADEDAAFATKARSLAARLAPASTTDVAVESTAIAPPALGLWDLEPTQQPPVTRREGPFTYEWTVTWQDFLTGTGRATRWDQSAMVHQVLNALAKGDAGYLDDGIDTALRLLAGGELVLSRFTNLLPDVFVTGAMRQVWPHALALADSCAARVGVPPTLADLLRTLVRFAPEVPRQELPPKLLALATAKGATKAQAEARVLREALAGPAGPVASRQPEPQPVRGLWRHEKPTRRLPQYASLPAPAWGHDELVRVLSAERSAREESCFPLCLYPKASPLRALPHTWTAELALAATVRAINAGGAEALRTSLVDVRRREQPLPIVAAVDLWAAVLLDVDSFWRIATKSEPWDWNKPMRWPQEWGRVGDAGGFADALSLDRDLPVQRPRNLTSPLQLAMFLRACEVLLLADRNGTVLSTPTWHDGTLELEDLLARLAASGDAGLGPLDVLQALHRLRPVDPARAGEVPRQRWFTEPQLTSLDSVQSIDVGALLREWIEAGGLPPLEINVEDSRWTSATEGPVSWSHCAAAPPELAHKTSELGGGLDALRTFPLWPDLANAMPAFGPRVEDVLPAGASGSFGTMTHAAMLSLMGARPSSPSRPDIVRTVVVMSQFGRLDPAAVTTAMALPRHWRLRDPAHDAYGALAYTWSRVFEEGGLAGSWSSALAVAVSGCREQPIEVGLPELLRMLADFAIEVPQPRASTEVLDALRSFVETSPRGAAQEHARLLVAALEEE